MARSGRAAARQKALKALKAAPWHAPRCPASSANTDPPPPQGPGARAGRPPRTRPHGSGALKARAQTPRKVPRGPRSYKGNKPPISDTVPETGPGAAAHQRRLAVTHGCGAASPGPAGPAPGRLCMMMRSGGRAVPRASCRLCGPRGARAGPMRRSAARPAGPMRRARAPAPTEARQKRPNTTQQGGRGGRCGAGARRGAGGMARRPAAEAAANRLAPREALRDKGLAWTEWRRRAARLAGRGPAGKSCSQGNGSWGAAGRRRRRR